MPETNHSIFSIRRITHADEKVNAIVVVTEDSGILKGHFPGQPVVPGACMLQLVKDVLELALKRKLRLTKADNIKFMNMIVPGGEKELELLVSYKKTVDNPYAVQASLSSQEAICFKFQGIFAIE